MIEISLPEAIKLTQDEIKRMEQGKPTGRRRGRPLGSKGKKHFQPLLFEKIPLSNSDEILFREFLLVRDRLTTEWKRQKFMREDIAEAINNIEKILSKFARLLPRDFNMHAP